MSADEIIRAWKSEDGEEKNEATPVNPAGEELSDEELNEVEGGGGFEQIDPEGSWINCSCQRTSC